MKSPRGGAGQMRLWSRDFLRTWFIDEGYIYEWLAAIALTIVNGVVPLAAIKPVNRFYIPTDPTLSYPAPTGTISGGLMYVLAFVFPGIVIVAFALFRRSFHDGHHGLLSLLEAFALASGWKRWMNLLGVYRPRWLTVLQSSPDDNAELQDSRQSYPSGHAAYTFCGCTVLTLYLLAKFGVLSQPGKGQFVLALLSLVPVVLATFVAMTRIYDYEHAPADVNAGAFIGLACGAFAYLLNFPSPLGSLPESALPRARVWSTQGGSAVMRVPGQCLSPGAVGEAAHQRQQSEGMLPTSERK